MSDSVSDTPDPWAHEAAVIARTDSPLTRVREIVDFATEWLDYNRGTRV